MKNKKLFTISTLLLFVSCVSNIFAQSSYQNSDEASVFIYQHGNEIEITNENQNIELNITYTKLE